MVARELMQGQVITVTEEDSLEDVSHRLQQEHVHGAPVASPDGELVGFVTQGDVLFGSLGMATTEPDSKRARLRVRDVMTSPAVAADEDTPIADLCRIMWRLRLHALPIVNDGRISGIVSSLDLARAVAEGDLKA